MKIFKKDINLADFNKKSQDKLRKTKAKFSLHKTNKKSISEDIEKEIPEMDDWSESTVPTAKKESKFRKFCFKYSVILYIFLAMFLDFAIESISRFSFIKAYIFISGSFEVFLYNTFIIFVTLTLSYLFRRRVFATILISGFWMLGGIANGAVLSYRPTPFTGTDMKLIKSALTLITKYMSIDMIILTIIITALFLSGYVVIAIKGPKIKGKMHYRRKVILISLLFLSIIPITKTCVNTRILSTYFGNISVAYEDYGFPYCFWCTVLARGIDCPNGYSKSEMLNLVVDEEDNIVDETPNIIFIQLESFVDPYLIKDVTYSEDPIPYFRSLKKNYTSGFLTVPVVGAGTANTEFEIITGMSLRYFGPGEYPYKTIMKDNVCESVAYNLMDLGYSTHAIHNNMGSFYSRKLVFSRLGFETFTSEEMLNITEYTPLGWAKDDVLKGAITDCLSSTEERDFVYTITVQSHGGYPSEQMLEDPLIQVNGITDEAKKNAMEYYVNEIKEVDDFIADLIEELSDYEEDTIVVLFGDHQPTLGLEEQNLENNNMYQTEYVIWDNMDLKQTDEDIASYQLAAVALDKVGIHQGTLMNFHQENMQSKNYFSDLELLQYDMLYGKKYVYGGKNPYERVSLVMGVKDITISSVKESELGTITVTGGEFNTFSWVLVNGEKKETTYVDENTLTYIGEALKPGDIFEVDQITAAGTVMRRGITYSQMMGGGARYSAVK